MVEDAGMVEKGSRASRERKRRGGAVEAGLLRRRGGGGGDQEAAMVAVGRVGVVWVRAAMAGVGWARVVMEGVGLVVAEGEGGGWGGGGGGGGQGGGEGGGGRAVEEGWEDMGRQGGGGGEYVRSYDEVVTEEEVTSPYDEKLEWVKMELEELVRVELKVSAVEVEVEGKCTMEVTDTLPLAMVFTDTSVVETPAAAAICAAKSVRKVVSKEELSNAVMLRVEKVMAEDTPETITVPGGGDGVGARWRREGGGGEGGGGA
ncbi:hypothetical protein CYMTET_27171 [Cymbomonas tetramitiformis]|uniref:Uncharacterized protein n=1 Tax=Cymbomonas tetramitiformis TaxID=36881 RepID=A0AAE0KX94_9CHLO|nr:hypothetical protein CYMTET_27171 [Cymbomonas tetramitiformis]